MLLMLQQVLRASAFALLSLFLISHFSIAKAGSSNSDEVAKQFSQAKKLAESGQIKQAISAYQTIIRLNPLLPEAYNNLAALYLQQKNTKQAKNILEQGLYAHKGYGVLYESLTAINVAMAREAYSKALQIELKPSEVSIAALPLSENNIKVKNKPIVISKLDTPAENKISVTKPVAVKATPTKTTSVKEKPLKTGAIKRAVVPTKLAQAAQNKIKKNEAIETTLQAWSAAWSAKAIDMYLSFYHQQYRPSRGLSRKGWVQSRRLKLNKPRWIKVAVSNFNIVKNNGRQAIVKFKQSYQSNTYRDVSSKRMVLLYTNNGWRIFQEKSI